MNNVNNVKHHGDETMHVLYEGTLLHAGPKESKWTIVVDDPSAPLPQALQESSRRCAK